MKDELVRPLTASTLQRLGSGSGIFPYGVGVSRGQHFYVTIFFVMHTVLIQKSRTVKTG